MQANWASRFDQVRQAEFTTVTPIHPIGWLQHDIIFADMLMGTMKCLYRNTDEYHGGDEGLTSTTIAVLPFKGSSYSY